MAGPRVGAGEAAAAAERTRVCYSRAHLIAAPALGGLSVRAEGQITSDCHSELTVTAFIKHN